jgi:2-keto-4-pentenoate hydratase/2-oxohepta-3-ene-1,7-dioic acid hydratase in catechol pathway
MTGTPSGIGYFQTPKYSLKDGDVVEITIEGLGKLTNNIRYE